MSTKFAVHTGTDSPVKGLVAVKPVSKPSFSIVAMSASATFMFLQLSINSAMAGLVAAALRAKGCCGATAK